MAGLGPNEALIGRADARQALSTPALLIDLPALDRNIATMAAFARQQGVGLRPHAKTHKSVAVARRQIAAGALGQCCATLGEAEALAGAGIPGVLITSPVVGAAKIERLMRLNALADGLMVVADDPAHVETLSSAAGAAGKPLTVLLDVDVGTHRTGVADLAAGVRMALAIARSNSLRFGGVQAYAGHLQHVDDYAPRAAAMAEQAARVAELRDRLRAQGVEPPLITGAGSGTHEIDARGGLYTELQVGSYVFWDVQYDSVVTRADGSRPFAPALFVQLSVVSAVHPRRPTTDGGYKRFATDGPAPRIVRGAPAAATYRFRGDEHGMIELPEGATPLPLGAKVECLTPHCDPTVNLYEVYHVFEGDTLVDIWPVDGRGR
jgi:D-serine deaminase-like pyridoxal phosphate-dependent protein